MTVARSELPVPSTMLELVGAVTVVVDADVTLKHPSVVVSELVV